MSLLFPDRCPACGELLDGIPKDEDLLCRSCRYRWELEKHHPCPDCGLSEDICGCSRDVDSVTRHLVRYVSELSGEEPMPLPNRLILAAKERYDRRLYSFLASELAVIIGELAYGDNSVIITSPPRGFLSVVRTGTDQGAGIAKLAAKYAGLRYKKLILRRGSSKQKLLSAVGRTENAEKSYRLVRGAEKICRGRHIILFDDIITTGATVSACRKLLYECGAMQVSTAALALSRSSRIVKKINSRYKTDETEE